MNIIKFLETIYLGDRGCKSLIIDGWNSEVKVQVTCISRVRSKFWDNYTDEDIKDGFIIFENVTGLSFDPPGLIPNDSINDIYAEPIHNDDSKYLIVMRIDSVDSFGNHTEVTVRIFADSMAIEDPQNPGSRISQ